jgi:hypothetical protein
MNEAHGMKVSQTTVLRKKIWKEPMGRNRTRWFRQILEAIKKECKNWQEIEEENLWEEWRERLFIQWPTENRNSARRQMSLTYSSAFEKSPLISRTGQWNILIQWRYEVCYLFRISWSTKIQIQHKVCYIRIFFPQHMFFNIHHTARLMEMRWQR